MAKSKDNITYGTSQAKLWEDEALRVAYKAGTPLEAGKIADSEPIDLFGGEASSGSGFGSTTWSMQTAVVLALG